MTTYHSFFIDSCKSSQDFNGHEALQVTITFGTNSEIKAFLDHLENILVENLAMDEGGAEE